MNEMLQKLGSQFPTTIEEYKHSWPFENDLSDLEEAYIEFEGLQDITNEDKQNEVGDASGIYVLLKKNTLLKLTYNFNKGRLIIDSIPISKISSIQGISINKDAFHGFSNQKIEIIMYGRKCYTFNEPNIIGGRYSGKFVCENTGRYNKVINLLMK